MCVLHDDLLGAPHTKPYFNYRSMCHDEAIYKDPLRFNPDRYAPVSEGGNGEPFPVGHFGFGRRRVNPLGNVFSTFLTLTNLRVCVGRHLAEATLWIAIATMLATLTLGNEIGPDGREIPPKVAFTAGLTRFDPL